MHSNTLNYLDTLLSEVSKYCPAWTEYTGKGADKKTKQLDSLASPLYDQYHTKLREPLHSFRGSVFLLGKTGLALEYMANELGEFNARFHQLISKGLDQSKGNQELHNWYKDLAKYKVKDIESAFVSDLKLWKEQLGFDQDVRDILINYDSYKRDFQYKIEE